MSTKPDISAIIPVYNNAQGLRTTLKSLVHQRFSPERYEIIIVDNNSTDDTLSVALEFVERYAQIIRVMEERDIQGSYAARNKGLKSAQGKIVAFVDADMSVDRDYLKNVSDFFDGNKKIFYAGANVEIFTTRKTIPALYNQLEGFDIKNCIQKKHFAPTCCLMVRREIFDKVGTFDPRLVSGGDVEFGHRVYEKGFSLDFAEDIVMEHPARSSWRSLFQKSFRIGKGYRQIAFFYKGKFPSIEKNPFNPVNYLPPRPKTFLREMRRKKNWTNVSISHKVLFYFVFWLCRMANLFGNFHELRHDRKKQPHISS
jgi:glycosyltransferase involved in cell wall biosynthesis